MAEIEGEQDWPLMANNKYTDIFLAVVEQNKAQTLLGVYLIKGGDVDGLGPQ